MKKKIKILSFCYLKYNFHKGKNYIFHVFKSTNVKILKKNINDSDEKEEME